MATVTGTNVKFVKVQTKQQYNDYTEKDGALIFVENERKIYVDGVAYGFSDSDVANEFLKLTGGELSGSLTITDGGNPTDRIIISNKSINFIESDSKPRSIEAFSIDLINVKVGNTDFTFREDSFVMRYGEDMDPIRISGLADPTHDIDAVNLGYLETNVINKIGLADGIASLDESGKVPSTQLPSYVDDVLEYSAKASFPEPGETGKLYVDLSNNNVWRWSGSAYVNVSDGNAHLTLGTTASTAYQGDRGKIAYDHSQLKGTDDNPHSITKANVGLGSVENYGIATDVEAKAGTINNKYMTPKRTKEAIEELAPRLSWEVVA